MFIWQRQESAPVLLRADFLRSENDAAVIQMLLEMVRLKIFEIAKYEVFRQKFLDFSSDYVSVVLDSKNANI